MGVDPFGARFGGGLDELFTGFFGGGDPFAAAGVGSRDAVGSPTVQRVDLFGLLDDAARELLPWAAAAAAAWGSPDLDTGRLPWAAT